MGAHRKARLARFGLTKIFINYRHNDSPGTAGRLRDHLQKEFGSNRLFFDVDIPAGVDFEKHLNDQLSESDVFLAVIGPNWLDFRDGQGHRRLDNTDDWVRVEISAALTSDISVIPILVDDADVPNEIDLPSQLKPLAKRQAIRLRNAEFDQDFAALATKLRKALGDQLDDPVVEQDTKFLERQSPVY